MSRVEDGTGELLWHRSCDAYAQHISQYIPIGRAHNCTAGSRSFLIAMGDHCAIHILLYAGIFYAVVFWCVAYVNDVWTRPQFRVASVQRSSLIRSRSGPGIARYGLPPPDNPFPFFIVSTSHSSFGMDTMHFS